MSTEHERARRRARRLGEAGRAQAKSDKVIVTPSTNYEAEHGTVLRISHIFSCQIKEIMIKAIYDRFSDSGDRR